MKPLYLFSVLIFLVLSCAHVPMNYRYEGPAALPDKIKQEYHYKPYKGEYRTTFIEKNNFFSIKQIKFKSTINLIPCAGDITIDYYEIAGEKKNPVII